MYTYAGTGTMLIGKTNRQEIACCEPPNIEGLYYEQYTYQAIKWVTIPHAPSL